MKIWLQDILACPICKHYPLNLYIFSYETNEKVFKDFINNYMNKDINFHLKEKIPEWTQDKDPISIKDNIVIEETNIKDYIDLIKSSIEEINFIFDKSSYDQSKKCFDIIKTNVKKKISEFSDYSNTNKIDEILPELNFLNRLKIEIEINTGLLFCNKCNRWYPIINSIPRMLPDEYREKEKDIEFLISHKNFLNEEFFNKNLKPFNL